MTKIKSISTMKIAEDWGYLIAVCEDGTAWARAFPVSDKWHEIGDIPDEDDAFIADHVSKNAA